MRGYAFSFARALTEANANLIAAAPEMLEALEWILDGGWNDGARQLGHP